MKIGIVTQPLHWNYGGILQNYALSTILHQMGHEPVTIFYQKLIPVWRYCLYFIKTVLMYPFPAKRRRLQTRRSLSIALNGRTTEAFVNERISKTHEVHAYTRGCIKYYQFDALVVGSDQVWRRTYNREIFDMFLDFASGLSVRRISYAASFGVDTWEFSKSETRKCAGLIKMFDGVSVREKSAVALCKDYLDVNAQLTLDPTLLLSVSDYEGLCAGLEKEQNHYIAAYILDNSVRVDNLILDCSKSFNLSVKRFSSNSNSRITVEEWLALYRDSDYVVTDSFHGTVFSIIFNKPFACVINESRGASRFFSLLEDFGLEDRIVKDNNIVDVLNKPIDWGCVNNILSERIEISLNFLSNSLHMK